MKKISKLIELDRDSWCALIDKWVLSEMARGMLRDFLLDSRTLEDIGEKYDRSVTQVKHILNKWQGVIFRHI